MNTVQGDTAGVGSAASAVVASALTRRNATGRAAAKDASGTNGASGSSAANAAGQDITSNDFLTLLVSELKNQDPTQPTDPNAYIQQLVGVNSLQQLIQINQGLTTIEGAGTTASPTPAAGS